MKIIASASSDTGLQRRSNEDQYFIDESLGLYVVCDGMGGHAAGEIASERAVAFATAHISANAQHLEEADQTPEGFFHLMKVAEAAVQHASRELYRMAKSSPEYAGMGTTMTLLLIVGDKAVMAHVGDSRLYLLRAGELHQLSLDHTLANELVQAGGLTEEEAAHSRYQHVLTRSIGPHELVDVDTLLFDIENDDRFLLCTDGLSNYFDDDTMVADILGDPDIVDHSQQLIDFANARGGSDNITAVIIRAMDDSLSSAASTQKRLDGLSRNFLGRDLTVSRLMHLLSIGTVIQCNATQELISKSAPVKGLYIVLEGHFRSSISSSHPGDEEHRQLAVGDCFGATALLSPLVANVSVLAAGQSSVLLIERRKFDRLTRRLPRLGNTLHRNLARHLAHRVNNGHSGDFSIFDATQPLS